MADINDLFPNKKSRLYKFSIETNFLLIETRRLHRFSIKTPEFIRKNYCEGKLKKLGNINKY